MKTKPAKTLPAIEPTPAGPAPWTAVGPSASPAPWISIAPAGSSAHGAFAAVAMLAGALGRADQRLLEAALFDGHSCTQLARALGVEAAEIRRRLGAVMLALHGALIGEPGDGAVAAMLALHALDALDPDEATLVDAMLAHQPALQRIHAGYCELVGELCLSVAHVAPPPCPVPSAVDANVHDAMN